MQLLQLFWENLYLGISCILDTCLLNDVILSLCALGCDLQGLAKAQQTPLSNMDSVKTQINLRIHEVGLVSLPSTFINEVLFKLNFDITTKVWF